MRLESEGSDPSAANESPAKESSASDSELQEKPPSQRGGKRRQAREMALQMLYQADLGSATAPQVLRSFDLSAYRTEVLEGQLKDEVGSLDYARCLVEGTLQNRDELDERIRTQADNWRLERMPVVDRNILRLAVFELFYQRDVPPVVVVDEAVDLAKKFGAENSGAFVNGVLDGMIHSSAEPLRSPAS